MQSKLFVALLILVVLPGCSEEIHAQDSGAMPSDEIITLEAAELPIPQGEDGVPDIELRTPVELD